MKRDISFLFLINIFSGIGYSLIAPLYPPMALKKGIGEDSCGFVIALFAISNFLFTPLCPLVISYFGRKKIFMIAMLLEVIFFCLFR
jgi:DHA1 family multidrug resistance protein-like MFS transporter